jgi:replicative DNA helicase
MAADNQPLDVLTVSEWMKGRFIDNGYHKRSFFEVIGGLSYLADLARDTPSSANIVAYANIVRHYSIRRQTLAFARKLSEKAFEKGSDEDEISALLEFAVSGAFELDHSKQNSQQQGFIAIKEVLNQHLESLQQLAKSDGKTLLGAASTLKKLDKHLSGFEQGKVYVLAGRPAMGKTTLGLNLVEGIAHTTGGVVGVFSLEMSTDQIISKMMASQGRIDFDHLRNPWQLSKTEWQSIAQSVTKISGMNLFIDDAAEQSPTTIRTRCYQLMQQTGKPLTAILSTRCADEVQDDARLRQ